MPSNAYSYWNRELETLPWRDVERWQAERVRAFIDGLPARSELYRAKLAGGAPPLRSLDDLARYPFTHKTDLRAAQEALCPQRPLGANQSAATADIVQVLSSSGTTGNPVYYGLTRRDLETSTDAIANAFFTAGIRAEDIVAHLVALPMVAGGLSYADAFRRIGAMLCWLGGFSTERIFGEMPRLQVSALLATTSFGTHLAERYAQAPERRIATLTKFLSGGEPGLAQPDIRARIRAGLGIDHIRECMGLGDVVPCMWAECEHGNGMHFNAQRYVAIELIDPASGERLEWREGANGEVVYTTFDRDATPVLRFRSRDHVVVTGAGCACGRTSPRMICIGRTDDMLIYKGMNVFPSAIRDLVAEHATSLAPLIRVWKDHAEQVRFDAPIAVEIEALPGIAAGEYARLKAAIETAVRARLQVQIAATILAAGSLPRSAYKTPLVAVRAAQ
ncbi:MAG: hypothetical protein U1F68_09510 [Gammaproteobacteria bacterium]